MATPAPSQFAALLRRSKFASFDPHIGQVYTSFDGHAARGNFGLKRPLAVRRRNTHITVQAVDSREQQTMWRSGEQQNRWIRMWDELGWKPKVSQGRWGDRIGTQAIEVNWLVDSEFAPQPGLAARDAEEAKPAGDEAVELEPANGEEEVSKRSWAIPNIEGMTDGEFARYLVKLRKLRPAFQEYLEKKYKNSDWAGSTTLENSFFDDNDFLDFLENVAYKEYHSARPRYIEQQPHRFAGLSYSHTPPLQNLLTTKPQRGRVINESYDDGALVASAGMTSVLSKGGRSTEAKQITTFRLTSAALARVPQTVGRHPQGMEGALVVTDVIEDSDATLYRTDNPHRPGSRQYVGKTKVFVPTGMTAVPKRRADPYMGQKHMSGPLLLTTLNQMQDKKKGRKPKEGR